MSTKKSTQKQKTSYLDILNKPGGFQKNPKFSKTYADQAKSANVRLAQRFSGKKGN